MPFAIKSRSIFLIIENKWQMTNYKYQRSNMIFDEAPDPQFVTSNPGELFLFLPLGYLLTVLIEAPILFFGLSKTLTWRQRFFAGFWLTACTYPIVILVLPILFASVSRILYLLVAETFAPVAECALFWIAFGNRLDQGFKTKLRNFGVITIANILSFTVGEVLNSTRWFGIF